MVPALARRRTRLTEHPYRPSRDTVTINLAVENNIEAIKALVERKARRNTLNDFGGSPLSEAAVSAI